MKSLVCLFVVLRLRLFFDLYVDTFFVDFYVHICVYLYLCVYFLTTDLFHSMFVRGGYILHDCCYTDVLFTVY